MKKNDRPRHTLLWIDLVRSVAIVLVVTTHVSADLFYAFGEVSMARWLTANLYQSFARIGVPFFFLSSGFLLLGREEKLGQFFRNRYLKILIPFIIWSIFFAYWQSWLFKIDINFSSTFRMLLNQEAAPHLWYIYAILGIYLSYPVFRIFVIHARPKLLWYYVIAWVLALTIIPTFENYAGFDLNINFKSSVGLYTGYIGYPLAGYLLGNLKQHNRLVAAMIPVAIISPFGTFLRTYIASEAIQQVNQSFYHYLSPNVVFSALASFYLLRVIGDKLAPKFHSRTILFLENLRKTGFGIYVIHPIFIQLMAAGAFGVSLSAFFGNPLISIPTVAMISLVLSYAATSIMKRIPVIKHTVL